jgi:hypothetical protein
VLAEDQRRAIKQIEECEHCNEMHQLGGTPNLIQTCRKHKFGASCIALEDDFEF